MTLAGFSHVSLTVTDLDKSREWYASALGWTELMTGRSDTTSFAVGQLPGGSTIVLRVHDEPLPDPFDARRVGLDHASFSVSTAEDLRELEVTLRTMGATGSPIQELPTAHVLSFRDRDDIALEAYLSL